MIAMSLTQVAKVLGLDETYPDVQFSGFSIDTRTLQKGNLFIALPGSKADGHEYLEAALKQGAAAALVAAESPTRIPQVKVDSPVEALGQISAAWRDQYHVPLIAITGSNGKTTLKNMISAILTAACCGNPEKVLATQGNLNNHIGLPLTLSRFNAKHQYAVIEMGMNKFGEIAYLSKLAKPNVAVITNASATHLEGVGDLAGVARAKAEIFLGLPDTGTAILNRDDAYYTFWQSQIKNRHYLTFGVHPAADIHAKIHDTTQTQLITANTPKGNIEINMPLLGKHNVFNALAATAATLAVGVDLDAVKVGIEGMQAAPGRLQLFPVGKHVNVIDDTYNANPFSLQAAIKTLITFPGKKILVLGDMKELGEEEKMLHQIAGESIRQAGVDYLFTFGDLSAHTAQAFGENAYHFKDQTKLINALKPFLLTDCTILVKGSRSMKMENVVHQLVNSQQKLTVR